MKAKDMPIALSKLNELGQDDFVNVAGPWFEGSPWVARRTWVKRPFASADALHDKLVATMNAAPREDQVRLIAAHPDLVGAAAGIEKLTPESTREQASAGLGDLTIEERHLFRRYNQLYRERFGFPFVICARENKTDAILEAFPKRLESTRDAEIRTALVEIAKIARLRMIDALRS